MPFGLPLRQAFLAKHMHAPCDDAALAAHVTQAASDHGPQCLQFLLLCTQLVAGPVLLQLLQLGL